MNKPLVSFWDLLKNFGISRVLLSWDLISSLLLTFGIILWTKCGNLEIDSKVFEILMPVSAALFGLLFTAFAIVISLTDANFVRILKKVNIYDNMIFPFWYVSILYLISVVFDLFAILTEKQEKVYHVLAIIALFLTLYSFLSTFYRIKATIKFGVYRAKFVDFELKPDDELKTEQKKQDGEKPSNEKAGSKGNNQ